MKTKIFAAIVISALGVGSAASADDQADPPFNPLKILKKDAGSDVFTFNYAASTSSALALAGLSADKTAPASSLKPFVMALPTVLGPHASGQSGALDIAPAWLLDNALTVDDYRREDRWLRTFQRARIGVALNAGSDGAGNSANAKPSIMALSLSTSLLDGSDPVIGGEDVWDKCVGEANASKQLAAAELQSTNSGIKSGIVAQLITNLSQGLQVHESLKAANNFLDKADQLSDVQIEQYSKLPATSPELAAVRGKLVTQESNLEHAANGERADTPLGKYADGIIAACAKKSSDKAAYAASVDIGTGLLWSGKAGAIRDLGRTGAVMWGAFRIPFDKILGKDSEVPTSYWIAGGSFRYSFHQMAATGAMAPAPAKFMANITDAWLGVQRFGETTKFGLQGGYQSYQATQSAFKPYSKSGLRYLALAGFRVNETAGLWVGGSYGNSDGTSSTLHDKTYMLYVSFSPPDFKNAFGAGN